jgi:ABC-type sugar transport system ATPase subunit
VRALDGVSLEVHAGRSSCPDGRERRRQIDLMKVLGGIYQPDEGKIIVSEQPVMMASPLEAKAKGIVFIHQELSLARS